MLRLSHARVVPPVLRLLLSSILRLNSYVRMIGWCLPMEGKVGCISYRQLRDEDLRPGQ